MRHPAHLAIVAGAIVALGGCSTGSVQPHAICTANYVFGITVNVRDSVTDTNLGGARGAVHDGQYVDSLAPFASAGADISGVSQLHAAGERAGTYTVEVVRPGYRPFSRSGVVVTKDECHVHPQTVTAALAPAS